MPDFSIITCISNPDIYQECVLNSVNACRDKHDIEFIPILNLEGCYSASLALNVGINSSKSDILIFCHQDVKLLGPWFDTLKEIIIKLDDWAILGTAGIGLDYSRKDIGDWGGARDRETVAVGTVWDDETHLDSSPYWDGVKEITKVHCVDECLFILNKKTGLRFDPFFNGFHFYGVDICLQARAAGFNVYCADLPIIHCGKYSGSFSNDGYYWLLFKKLRDKWIEQFPELLGTHMHWAEDELTTYIPIVLESDIKISIKSIGVRNIDL